MQGAKGIVMAVLGMVIALVAGVGVLVATTRTGAADVQPSGVRRFAEVGLTVPIPDGWVDKQRSKGSSPLLVEVEHRPVMGLFPTRGMWANRWSPADATGEVAELRSSGGWKDSAPIGGFPVLHHQEVIGPAVVQQLPGSVVLHRSLYRVVAFDRFYDIGFWGPEATLGDSVERAVLARVRIEAPAPLRLKGDGWSLTAPSGWNRGDCKGVTVCVFGPWKAGKPAASWVYVMPWKGESLEAASSQLATNLAKNPKVQDVRTEPRSIGGRAAVGIRFTMLDSDGGGTPGEIDDVIVPLGSDGKRFVLLALGWRSPEGRAELDSIVTTVRL
jgi:hypothetical protein